jgi:hypothetical protein
MWINSMFKNIKIEVSAYSQAIKMLLDGVVTDTKNKQTFFRKIDK